MRTPLLYDLNENDSYHRKCPSGGAERIALHRTGSTPPKSVRLYCTFFQTRTDLNSSPAVNGLLPGSGRNRQGITIQFVESNLVRARPRFVPRNIHVMDDLFTVYRVRPCIGDHAPLEFYFLLVRWNQIGGFGRSSATRIAYIQPSGE